MGYSSDVSDKEWEIIEPLLFQKKKTQPPVWTCAANPFRGYFINSRTVVIRQTFPELYHNILLSSGIT
ncbi:hypothetical protein QUA42_20175 [Microcoleus sp. Pol11C2]|uniref:hypothetical protein n=1 Tax=Microcoleus sp. Pol11C2 TaxID=3055389 RepID=UPI002FD47CBE